MSVDITTAALRDYRPVEWAHIPDLGLYMDQVVTFVTRACAPLFQQDARRCLTPAMVNNYVKARLLPRPVGKKYGRDQLALLIMIATLKQVAALEDVRRMLALPEGASAEPLYTGFCHRLERALRGILTPGEPAEPPESAMDFAIMAAACSAACAAALADDARANDEGKRA